MNSLDVLEQRSIHLLREAFSAFPSLCMLWSIGKDSTVLLHLARKAFFSHVPFPLVHIDTGYKLPEMIRYRDQLAHQWKLTLLYGQHETALSQGMTYPAGKLSHLECCQLLKTQALKDTLSGKGKRYRLNLQTQKYELDSNTTAFTGVIAGIRADEEGSRSKELYFSPRNLDNRWNIGSQPPEFWNHYKTEFPPGTHVRIHPLLDWTELTIWEYIQREEIPTVSLYYNSGEGKRYRSLGCYPCTTPIESQAENVQDIIDELKTGKLAKIAERSGRAQDKADEGTLESLRRTGYM